MRKMAAAQSGMYTSFLCALAFVSFWEHENIAGMIFILLGVTILGLGLGQLMNSPCPVTGLPPDSDSPPPPPPHDPLPTQELPDLDERESPFIRDLLSRPAWGETIELRRRDII
jgi:hypothetical protein